MYSHINGSPGFCPFPLHPSFQMKQANLKVSWFGDFSSGSLSPTAVGFPKQHFPQKSAQLHYPVPPLKASRGCTTSNCKRGGRMWEGLAQQCRSLRNTRNIVCHWKMVGKLWGIPKFLQISSLTPCIHRAGAKAATDTICKSYLLWIPPIG